MTNTTDLEANLRNRPPFEEAQQQYRAAVKDWATQIATATPGLTWRIKEDSWSGCLDEYANTRGVRAYVYVVFDGPIPEAVWPAALDIVTRGAAGLGAEDFTTTADAPGDHNVMFGGGDRAAVTFGTQAAGILSARSDCRLRQADWTPGPNP